MTAGSCDVASVRWLPGWSLRVAVLVLCLAAIVLVSTRNVQLFAVIPLIGLSVLGAWVPASVASTMVIAGVAALAALSGGSPLRWEVLLLVPVVHLVHLSAGVAALLPSGARVHPAALRGVAVRFLAVQFAVFAGIGLLALVTSNTASAVVDAAALLAVLAGMLTWLVVLRRRPRSRR